MSVPGPIRARWGEILEALEATRVPSSDQALIRPILRWAGGKSWLVQQYPDLFDVSYARYLEPFLGGAALFIHANPSDPHISDANCALIECYSQVASNPLAVWELYSSHVDAHGPESYSRVREFIPPTELERAARLIYLNRSCFNGLYRVNRAGLFNVPLGSPRFQELTKDALLAFAGRMQGATVSCGDFETLTSGAAEGDLLVLDPPYTVMHNQNGFVRYNESIFSWADQERLASQAACAATRGVKVIATNAAHPSVVRLYPEGLFELRRLLRKSSVAARGEFRGQFTEVLITSRNMDVA